MGAFGDKLRKQREQRGISLDAISAITKISPRMLRAIEDEHFDQLPGGVFNKGFVRAYARQVGLDEDEAVSDYLAALRESQIQSQTILPNFRTPADYSATPTEDPRPAPSNPSVDVAGESHRSHNAQSTAPRGDQFEYAADSSPDRRLRPEDRRQQARRSADRDVHFEHAHPNETHAGVEPPEQSLDRDVPSPPLSFLSLDSARPTTHFDPSGYHDETAVAAPVATDHSSVRASVRVPWEKLAVALLLITLTLALWAFHRHSRSAAASQPATSSPATLAVAAPASNAPSVRPSSVPKSPASSRALVNHPAATSPDADGNPPLAKLRPHQSAPPPPPRFTLVIRAEQTSWVSITADGQPVAQETLIAPANTSVRASHEIVVKTGNAAGISFLLDGRDIPNRGTPGEVRTYSFDATGMRASSAGQPANTIR